MQPLIHQRCFNHATREAVARCPECARFFCRECVTEHDDRVVCSACLKQVARVARDRGAAWRKFLRLAQCVAGVVLAWFFFFVVGASLVKIPATFHDGTLWRAKGTEGK
jgi:hypothetical protein